MITYAFVNSADGRVEFCVSPSDSSIYKDGQIVDGRLVKVLPSSLTTKEAIDNKRWTGSRFEDMPEKPGDYYLWNGINWEFDEPSFLSAVRERRRNFLVASDWTQVLDASVDSTVWAAYRQELRDLPSTLTGQERSLEDVTWPSPPTD